MSTGVQVNWSFCSLLCARFGNEIIGSDGSWRGWRMAELQIYGVCVCVCVCVCVWGVRFTCMPGLTALRGWSASNRAEINSRLHHKSAPSRCPLPMHATLRFGLWNPPLMTYTHTRSLACTFTHIPPPMGKQQTARPCKTYTISETLTEREARPLRVQLPSCSPD